MFKFKKRHPPPGAQPGTLAIDEDAPAPKVHVIRYTAAGTREEEIVDADRLEMAESPDTVAWIDVQGFGDEPTIRRIGEIFGLHHLVVEDVVNVPQRPKAEAYDEHLLIVTRRVRLVGPLSTDIGQVSIVLGKNYVITFQERPGDVLDPVRRRLKGATGEHFRQQGADYLAYGEGVDIMASIFIPLTFLAGVYGMNFQNMPELQVWWAYPLLWLVMALLAGGMLVFFRRKRWIGPARHDGWETDKDDVGSR